MHFDEKHLVKCLHELLKSFTRGCIVHQHRITGAVAKVGSGAMMFLHPDDAQNIPLAIGL